MPHLPARAARTSATWCGRPWRRSPSCRGNDAGEPEQYRRAKRRAAASAWRRYAGVDGLRSEPVRHELRRSRRSTGLRREIGVETELCCLGRAFWRSNVAGRVAGLFASAQLAHTLSETTVSDGQRRRRCRERNRRIHAFRAVGCTGPRDSSRSHFAKAGRSHVRMWLECGLEHLYGAYRQGRQRSDRPRE